MAEGRISEPKDSSEENIKNREKNREEKWNESQMSVGQHQGHQHTYAESPKRRRRKRQEKHLKK